MIIHRIFYYSRSVLTQEVLIRRGDPRRGFFFTYTTEHFTTYTINQKRR